MFSEYFALAFGSLKKRKLRSWLTMIGIFIGIAAVVSLIGLGEGLRTAVTSQFNMLGTDILTIQASGVFGGPPGFGASQQLTTKDADKIGKVAGIGASIGRIIKSGKIDLGGKATVGIVASIPEREQRKEFYDIASVKAAKGRLLKDEDAFKVVVGSEYGTDHFGKELFVGDRIKVQDKTFEVAGILAKKGTFVFDHVILMNEDVMRSLYDEKENVNVIAARVKQGFSVRRAKENIEQLLRKQRDVDVGEENFSVESAESRLQLLDSTLFAIQIFVSIIASISLLVGGIGITNTMYTAVVERTKEIGIMKSIGAQNADVFWLFLIESGLLGFVGGSIGVAIGASLAKGMAFAGSIYFGSDLIRANLSLFLIAGSLLFSFLLGCIAGITPAMRASRLSPVGALRYTA